MNFCDCMYTEQPDGTLACNQCGCDIMGCSCKQKHAYLCPDNRRRKIA